MIICRAIMDLGKTRAYVHQTKNPWQGQIRALHERVNAAPEGYRDDLKRLAAQAKALGAEQLTLPACTLVLEDPSEQQGLIDTLEIQRLATGALSGEREYALFRDSKGRAHDFTARRSLACNDGANWMTAISSSVKHFKTPGAYEVIAGAAPVSRSPALVCDLGHHQYSGRYTLTLRSVRHHLEANAYPRSSVVLSFWKYRGSQSRAHWLEGGRLLRRVYHRNAIGGEDYLDLVEVSA